MRVHVVRSGYLYLVCLYGGSQDARSFEQVNLNPNLCYICMVSFRVTPAFRKKKSQSQVLLHSYDVCAMCNVDCGCGYGLDWRDENGGFHSHC